MTSSDERLEILEMIQRGTISPQEGLKLIEALGETWDEDELDSGLVFEPTDAVPNDIGEDFDRDNNWWTIPFGIGAALTTLGGALMYTAWSAKGLGAGFILAWIPFLLGVGTMVLGWNSQTGPWVHIRINQKPGETPRRIAISLPLPIRFLAWAIRNFGSHLPGMDATGVDEVILALERRGPGDPPLSIDISDNEDGEEIKVFIG